LSFALDAGINVAEIGPHAIGFIAPERALVLLTSQLQEALHMATLALWCTELSSVVVLLAPVEYKNVGYGLRALSFYDPLSIDDITMQ